MLTYVYVPGVRSVSIKENFAKILNELTISCSGTTWMPTSKFLIDNYDYHSTNQPCRTLVLAVNLKEIDYRRYEKTAYYVCCMFSFTDIFQAGNQGLSIKFWISRLLRIDFFGFWKNQEFRFTGKNLEFDCENSYVKAVNYFRRKARSLMFDWVLNTPLATNSS